MKLANIESKFFINKFPSYLHCKQGSNSSFPVFSNTSKVLNSITDSSFTQFSHKNRFTTFSKISGNSQNLIPKTNSNKTIKRDIRNKSLVSFIRKKNFKKQVKFALMFKSHLTQ